MPLPPPSGDMSMLTCYRYSTHVLATISRNQPQPGAQPKMGRAAEAKKCEERKKKIIGIHWRCLNAPWMAGPILERRRSTDQAHHELARSWPVMRAHNVVNWERIGKP